MGDGLGKGLHRRLAVGEVFFAAADHDRELAVLRPFLAAGDRRGEEADAFCRRRCGQFTGDDGAGRGVVDDQAPLPCSRQDSGFSQRHGAKVIVVADAGDDDIRAGSGLGRRFGAGAFVFSGPGFSFFGGAVVNGDVKAGLGQMPGHGKTHVAEADECCFFCAHDGSFRGVGAAVGLVF